MKSEAKISESITFISEQSLVDLKRLQELYFNGVIKLFDQEVHATHHERSSSSSFFNVHDNKSFIVIENLMEENSGETFELVGLKNAETCSTPVKENYVTNGAPDLDITGSPLKCPFKNVKNLDLYSSQELHQNSNLSVQSYNGLPLRRARFILSKLNFALKILKGANSFLPPFWIACDGKDPANTVFIGIYVTEEVSFTSVMHSSRPYIGADDLPSLDSVNEQFSFAFPLPCVDSEVEACYEVHNKDSSSSIHLRSHWSRPNSILCHPKLDTLSTVFLRVEPSDLNSHSYFLYSELKILQNLIAGLEQSVIEWTPAGSDVSSMTSSLNDYITNFAEAAHLDRKESCRFVYNLDDIVENTSSELRTKFTFTDQMWNILKRSSSGVELEKGLNTVFTKIQKGFIRPQIHVKNNTQFAVICRDLMRRMIEVPRIEGTKVVEILIELGLEKIRNDYAAAFKEWSLGTTEQIAPFFEWDPSETLPKSNYSDCLVKLRKLHLVLLCTILIKAHLSLPNASLSVISSKMLGDLRTLSHLPKDFEFQVQTSTVKDVVNRLTPTSWVYKTWNTFKESSPRLGKWFQFHVKKGAKFFNNNDNNESDDVEASNRNTIETLKNDTADVFHCLTVTNVTF